MRLKLRQFGRSALRAVLHPIFPVIVFIFGSVYIKKIDEGAVTLLRFFEPKVQDEERKVRFESTGEFYPFSNFPMYANPRNRKLEFFFLEDGEGQPIPSFAYTGFTAARIKKKMISASKAWGKERGLTWNKKKHWLDDAARTEIGATLLADLRIQANERGTPFTGTMKMMRALIFVGETGEIELTSKAIASDPMQDL